MHILSNYHVKIPNITFYLGSMNERRCAYCNKEGNLTREHIWPKCIIKRMPELEAKYLKSQEKFFSSELIISDVCAECNNVKLSVLDAYLCQLYDKYFGVFTEAYEEIVFEYDYELLLRSLLKITYNSSRTINRTENYFNQFKEFILAGGKEYENIIIKLDLIKPSVINGGKVYPKSARCGTIDIDFESENLILRVVSINSYCFFIIIHKEVFLKDEHIDEYWEVFNRIPGTIIHPYKDNVEVKSIGSNTSDIHSVFIKNTHEAFEEYINKKNNR